MLSEKSVGKNVMSSPGVLFGAIKTVKTPCHCRNTGTTVFFCCKNFRLCYNDARRKYLYPFHELCSIHFECICGIKTTEMVIDITKKGSVKTGRLEDYVRKTISLERKQHECKN